MQKKFSLIEILVVMAIIGVLVSLLIPTLSSARKKSRATVCASNLKQLGAASIMFALDNEGRIIYSGKSSGSSWWDWHLQNGNYIEKSEESFTCPSLPYEGDWHSENYLTYGAANEGNRARDHRTGRIVIRDDDDNKIYEGVKMTQVESPSEFFWYADSAKGAGAEKQWINFVFRSGVDHAGMRIHTRHNEAGNIWFIDGHVAPHKIGTLKQLGFNSGWTESGTQIAY
ncbi:prepilin-type N-terminal cleavage/methylation domain-containing protein [Lentisphaera marina]|uniref:prepilin-type N-terminal cleavage/methylation domain-containing protein n=1 Tax=Lentisphaera marina TaxID=1111041 RepID=UPI00236547A1|nr:prepilin-type N-terminal cleavage/methylation domain-containing protein [Lentisphaera marina]MDD7985094.1 prepilin-type N-terminal cleavage/methylation domain-containing protein [Lentisphaera marina]